LRSLVKYVAVVCLLLTSWSAVVLVAHHHSKGTESICAICVAAHSSSPATAATLLHLAVKPLQTLHPEPLSAKGRITAFQLSVRPPPAV
jgi:hypothetical protein